MNPFEARDIWPPGTVVDRKYIIDATLGRGSFGTAYRCHHRVLARTYVIKRLHSQFAEDDGYVQKFIQEARAIERLRGCPQIVEIYDMTQTEDGKLILVMENMVGGDLESLIRRQGRFKVEDAVWYALQIAQGLAAAHAAGLVHRDVKPENVLLGADPREAKLTDFGIVADRDVASPTSVIRGGSIGYAAPEQWHMAGKYLDGRADLYSLGVTLYRMLTGQMPFGEVEIGGWIERVRTTAAPPLRSVRADVPEPLERLTVELLATERDQRPPNAVAVIERLKALNFPAIPPEVRPPTLEEPPRRKTQDLVAQQYGSPVPTPPSLPPQPPPYNRAPYVTPPTPIVGPRPSTPVPMQYPQYATPYPQPPVYYTSPNPLPLPPPPPVLRPSSKAWIWLLVLPILGALGAGGWWISNHRPAKKNSADGLTYVWIPPGKFTMGCDLPPPDCRKNEAPAHEVTITKGFYLGQTETTIEAYKRYADANRIPMPGEYIWKGRSLDLGWKVGDLPMNQVSWNQAAKYCEWIGGRLPTEAEWEYAARAGTSGTRYGDLEKIAWFADNAGRSPIDSLAILKTDQEHYDERVMDNGATIHSVGMKAPNAFGLYDMIGNVWEWVNDYWDPEYYSSSAAVDPQSGPRTSERIGRGGSFFMHSGRNTVTARSNQKQDYINAGFGFRCAWNAPLF